MKTLRRHFHPCVKTVKGRGGVVFIYQCRSNFRIILYLDLEQFILVRKRFKDAVRAERFGRKLITEHRIKAILEDDTIPEEEEVNHGHKYGNFSYHRPEWRAYKQSIITGHDGLYITYWFKKGMGRAYADTYSKQPGGNGRWSGASSDFSYDRNS